MSQTSLVYYNIVDKIHKEDIDTHCHSSSYTDIGMTSHGPNNLTLGCILREPHWTIKV